jgi:hypothetical protein
VQNLGHSHPTRLSSTGGFDAGGRRKAAPLYCKRSIQLACCVALGWFTTGGFAQSVDTGVDATSAAAMARAQRAASNPMRVILEASKIKRRVPEGELVETAASAPPVVSAEAPRKPVVKVLAATPAPPNNSRPAAALVALAPAAALAANPSAAPALPQAAPAPALPPTPAPAVPQAATVEPAVAADTPAAAPAALLAVAAAMPSPAAAPDPAVLASAALPAAKPRMLSMVAPDIPARVLQQAGRIGEVLVDLALRRDGSVASVNMLPPASRLIQRYVVQALEKWRYEPLEQDTVHRVQLVFNDEP